MFTRGRTIDDLIGSIDMTAVRTLSQPAPMRPDDITSTVSIDRLNSASEGHEGDKQHLNDAALPIYGMTRLFSRDVEMDAAPTRDRLKRAAKFESGQDRYPVLHTIQPTLDTKEMVRARIENHLGENKIRESMDKIVRPPRAPEIKAPGASAHETYKISSREEDVQILKMSEDMYNRPAAVKGKGKPSQHPSLKTNRIETHRNTKNAGTAHVFKMPKARKPQAFASSKVNRLQTTDAAPEQVFRLDGQVMPELAAPTKDRVSKTQQQNPDTHKPRNTRHAQFQRLVGRGPQVADTARKETFTMPTRASENTMQKHNVHRLQATNHALPDAFSLNLGAASTHQSLTTDRALREHSYMPPSVRFDVSHAAVSTNDAQKIVSDPIPSLRSSGRADSINANVMQTLPSLINRQLETNEIVNTDKILPFAKHVPNNSNLDLTSVGVLH